MTNNTDTSAAARAAVLPLEAERRERALAVFATGNYTADECGILMDLKPFSIRPLVCYLKKDGLVEDSGERRPNPESGKKAIVWRLVL